MFTYIKILKNHSSIGFMTQVDYIKQSNKISKIAKEFPIWIE